MESIDAFIDRLPKAELHLHLVGSASVPTALELARRHPGRHGQPDPERVRASFLDRAAKRALIGEINDVADRLSAADA